MALLSQMHKEANILRDKITRWSNDLERCKKQLRTLEEKILRENMRQACYGKQEINLTQGDADGQC